MKAVTVPVRTGICRSCKYSYCYKDLLLSRGGILVVRHAFN